MKHSEVSAIIADKQDLLSSSYTAPPHLLLWVISSELICSTPHDAATLAIAGWISKGSQSLDSPGNQRKVWCASSACQGFLYCMAID